MNGRRISREIVSRGRGLGGRLDMITYDFSFAVGGRRDEGDREMRREGERGLTDMACKSCVLVRDRGDHL